MTTETSHQLAILTILVVMLLSLGVACGQTEEATATRAPRTATLRPSEPAEPAPTRALTAVEHFNRGVDYQEQGRLDLAIKEYTRAIALDLQYADAHFNRGLAYFEKGDYDRGIADFDQAISLDPQDAGAYLLRGLAYIKKGQLNRAMADLSNTIKIDTNNAIACSMRGTAYAAARKRDFAISDLERALELGLPLELRHHVQALLSCRSARCKRADRAPLDG